MTEAAQPKDQKWHWSDLHDLQGFRCQKPFSSWEISCKEYWSPPTFLHFELTVSLAFRMLWYLWLWQRKLYGGTPKLMATLNVYNHCVYQPLHDNLSPIFFYIFLCHFNDSNIHLGNIHVYLSAYLSKNDFPKEKAMLSFSYKLLHCWLRCTNNLACVYIKIQQQLHIYSIKHLAKSNTGKSVRSTVRHAVPAQFDRHLFVCFSVQMLEAQFISITANFDLLSYLSSSNVISSLLLNLNLFLFALFWSLILPI